MTSSSIQRLLITGPRQAVWDETPVPDCNDDEILVRARVTAVSTGTEIRVYRAIPVDQEGKFLHERIPFELPTENGYSMVGNVIAVGKNVVNFSVGDRVFVPAPHKQIAAVPAVRATKLPDDIPDERAVFLSILEVAHISLRRGNPIPGENVAILGQGVIGLAALAYCRAFGFRTVVFDFNETRLKIAEEMGADLALSPGSENYLQTASEYFNGEGADLILEAASKWSAIEMGMHVAGQDARIVVISRHVETPEFNPVGHPHLGKRLSLLASYGYPVDGSRWDRAHSVALTLDLLQRDKLQIAPMVTHEFSWEELPEVYRRFDEADPDLIGTVIRW